MIWSDITLLNNLLLDANFDKFSVELYYIHILSMLVKFHDDEKSIIMLSINCLNSSFCRLKEFIKDEFIDHMVNNIWLTWKLICILSTYRTCNSMVGFLKYEFNNKLLSGVTLLRVKN